MPPAEPPTELIERIASILADSRTPSVRARGLLAHALTELLDRVVALEAWRTEHEARHAANEHELRAMIEALHDQLYTELHDQLYEELRNHIVDHEALHLADETTLRQLGRKIDDLRVESDSTS